MLRCLHCQSYLSGKYQKKFCDRSCSASYNNKFKIKNGKYIRLTKNCFICKKETDNPKFCSIECKFKGASLPRKYKTEEEKLHAKRMRGREATARYAAKKKNQTPSDADLNEIKEFYLNCPIGYEVDHIIPISKRGLHTLSNLQYLTISENRKKWCKIMEPLERFELS
jgi:hypothetical protein